MAVFQLPTAPVVYERATGGAQLCATCPEFAAKCDGSESGEHPVEGPSPLDDDALRRLRAHVGQEAETYLAAAGLPLAIRLRVVQAGRTIKELEGLPSVEASVDRTTDPKALARMYLRSLAKNVVTLHTLHQEGGTVDSNELGLILLIEAQKNCLAGLLAGIDASARGTTKRGADGRRKLGDETRERVRIAAQPYLGRMSKERAATEIATSLNKGTGSVRRLLSLLYPGDTWRHNR